VTTTRGEDTEAQSLTDTLDAELNNFWLVGREYNSCLWVSNHSPNMDSLPFIGSRDSRSAGQLVFLCKCDKRDFIEQALNNPNLIPSNKTRAFIKQTLDSLGDIGRERIVLSNVDNWTLGIIPAQVNNEYENYKILWETAARELKLEASEQPEFLEVVEAKPELSETARKVYEYLENADGERSIELIRKSRRLSATEAREAIEELIKLELIIEVSSDEYVTT
jgi:hypothetical protein